MSFEDRDRGAMALLKRAAALANHTRLSVGIPADAPAYPDGTPVQVVAAAHEFGTSTVPQRSFIRGWYDQRTPMEHMALLLRAAHFAIREGGLRGKVDAFESIGALFVKEIRERIDRHIPPPLQDETVRRKAAGGSSTPMTPLVETGHLKECIKSEVEFW